MGTNFSTRYSNIFKYGKYKRAVMLYKEYRYVDAYKQLAEAFNLPQIKKNFDPSYNAEKYLIKLNWSLNY